MERYDKRGDRASPSGRAEEAIARAQAAANKLGVRFLVLVHVGAYGWPSGDIKATDEFRVAGDDWHPNREGPNPWSLYAICDPEPGAAA